MRIAIAASSILLALWASQPPATSAHINAPPEDMPTGSMTYRLRSLASDLTCVVSVGTSLGTGVRALSAEPGCGRLLPALAHARYWREEPEGVVAFAAEHLDPLLTFAIADGVAYESLDPQLPVFALEAD
jgi:hypothetical protein